MHAPTTTSERRRRLLARCGALALLPLLSGCIAALAVPAMTAAGVFSERKRVRAATTPTLAPVVTVDSVPEPVATQAALAPVPAAQPAPAAAPLNDVWRPFVSYTLERAQAMREQRGPPQSALLLPDSRYSLAPSHRPCRASEPAVIVDLDVGPAAFAPGTAAQPAPGLAAALARLRAEGIVVLWLSQIDANRVNDVAQALRDSGLDAGGRDPLLLVRNKDERKQVLREEAGEDVCILAIAGDRRSDFDELFDYLRDPASASALDVMVGAGWFLAPAPLEPAVTAGQ